VEHLQLVLDLEHQCQLLLELCVAEISFDAFAEQLRLDGARVYLAAVSR